jgi:hypothetical protein
VFGLGLIWWFFGVYRVQGTTNEESVANAIHVDMQCHHLYITRHAAKATNGTTFYQAKDDIVDNDMV